MEDSTLESSFRSEQTIVLPITTPINQPQILTLNQETNTKYSHCETNRTFTDGFSVKLDADPSQWS
jgi:hypothetical protein